MPSICIVTEAAVEILEAAGNSYPQDELLSELYVFFKNECKRNMSQNDILFLLQNDRRFKIISTQNLVKLNPPGIAFGRAFLGNSDRKEFADYVSDILTRFNNDEKTVDWPTIDTLKVLIQKGSKFGGTSGDVLEKEIKDLSGKPTDRILLPIDSDNRIKLKKLVEIEEYVLPRSILNEMTEALIPVPLRLSELYAKLKTSIAPNLPEQDEPKFRRALLNKIARTVDGERFEYIFDPANPDVSRIRLTDKYIGRELEPRSARTG